MIYEFLIQCLKCLTALFGLINDKARLRTEGNLYYLKTLSKRNFQRKLIWFHCASLGEFEQGRPLIEAFKAANADWQILLTFFSPSGYAVRKNYPKADIICYLPFDQKSEVIHFFDALRPDFAVFVKYEFWRNYIFEACRRGIPLISVSSIFRERQAQFRFWGAFQRHTLQAVNHFFVQNQHSLALLQKIDIDQISLAGDTRFDSVRYTAQNSRPIALAAQFKADGELMVCGSVWPEDMRLLIPFIQKRQKMKFIIAPHEIDIDQIKKWQMEIHKDALRFSEINEHTDLALASVLFIDNVGMLSSLYQYADFAFVGGGFKTGLHNILEAAVFGSPIFFGNKKYGNFQEAIDLLAMQVVFAVAEITDFERIFDDLSSHKRAEIKQAALAYIEERTGATKAILDWMAVKIND